MCFLPYKTHHCCSQKQGCCLGNALVCSRQKGAGGLFQRPSNSEKVMFSSGERLGFKGIFWWYISNILYGNAVLNSKTSHYVRTLVETRLELTLVVYHLRKRFRKIRLESKWITTPCIVPAENVRGQRNIWKGSLVFADGMLQTEIRVPFLQSHLWYKFQAFAAVFQEMELTCLNGKRYSGTKFTSPDMLWYAYSLFLDYLRNVYHHHLLQYEVSFLYILFSLLHTFR